MDPQKIADNRQAIACLDIKESIRRMNQHPHNQRRRYYRLHYPEGD